MAVHGGAEVVPCSVHKLRNCLTSTMHSGPGRALPKPACVYSFPTKVNTAVNITITQNYGAYSLC